MLFEFTMILPIRLGVLAGLFTPYGLTSLNKKKFTALAASKTERDSCSVVGPDSRCLEFASLVNFMYAFNASFKHMLP